MAVAIGLASVLLGAASAQAATPSRSTVVEDEPFVVNQTTCVGTYVAFGSDPAVEWTVTVGGRTVWPKDGDEQLGPGEVGSVLVPLGAGDIEVDYEGSLPEEGWPRKVTERLNQLCDELPDITYTQPTCEVPTGEIEIPDLAEAVRATGEADGASDEQIEASIEALVYRLDDTEVQPGSSQSVSPGMHTVTVGIQNPGGEVEVPPILEVLDELTVMKWVVEIEAPTCPNLPATGNRVGLIAGTALLLVVVGSGLYLLGRRRRVAGVS